MIGRYAVYMTTLNALNQLKAEFSALKAQNLSLNMQRGQPSDIDFDLSNGMLEVLTASDIQCDGIDIRNYPGGIYGLPSARKLFAKYLDLQPDNVLVWNNSSLEVQGLVLTFALLHGLPNSPQPWHQGHQQGQQATKPKIIVTTPGYDRHYVLLKTLGFELLSVDMQSDGPDVEAIEQLVTDSAVKGLVFVPTYSNPTGDSISEEKAKRLVALQTAAPDFTIFADDAYRVHHLSDDQDVPVNLVELSAEAGYPDRAFVFASTSKVTFAGAGLGFVGSSPENIDWLGRYLSAQSIGPNKVEQARHVKFLSQYQDGLRGLMRDHAALIAPKFEAVYEALSEGLGADGGGYATWTKPKGGYFVSMDTVEPVADRVIALAKEVGISLTSAGATFPESDPNNSNIRIAPTRPTLEEVKTAMSAVTICIRLATEEHRENLRAQQS